MYGILDIFQSIVAEYNAAKSAEMIKESMQLRRDGSHAQMLLYDFYTSGRINPEQTLMNSREVAQALQEALTTIEQQMQ
jgi:hypothetical protein